MKQKLAIPHKCIKCDKQLYIDHQRSYIYFKGNYICKDCFNIPKIGLKLGQKSKK